MSKTPSPQNAVSRHPQRAHTVWRSAAAKAAARRTPSWLALALAAGLLAGALTTEAQAQATGPPSSQPEALPPPPPPLPPGPPVTGNPWVDLEGNPLPNYFWYPEDLPPTEDAVDAVDNEDN